MDRSQAFLDKYKGGRSGLSIKNAGEQRHISTIVVHNPTPIIVDPSNWEWDNTGWVVADRPWQDLKEAWYGEEVSMSSSLPLPFIKPGTILVRDCYVTTFDRIWARAFQSRGETGTIISGQPGTGGCLLVPLREI
jgi:hypothetical protein